MIRLFSPYIPKEAGGMVKEVIDSGWINTGKKEALFREVLRYKFKFPYCVATNSCTSALRLSLAVAGVKHGDEVISTPWTMIATNTAILEQGAKVVFADIEYDTLNIDVKSVEDKITDNTKAIMIVHYAGCPCDLDKIYRLANDYSLMVIEDAAHALGSKYKHKYIGQRGDFVCFSFQTVKIITAGDGGVVATSRERVSKELSKRSWFGIDKQNRIKTVLGAFPKDISKLGFKYNMNDITATLGIASLRHFDEIYNRRRYISRVYNEEFADLDKIQPLNYPKDRVSNNWMYPMHVEDRDEFAKHMRDKGIEVGTHFHRNDMWSLFKPLRNLPNTQRVENDIMHIPIHTSLSDDEIGYIVKSIKEWDSKNI